MVGAYLGRRMLLNGRALPPSRGLTIAAVAVLAAGLLLRLSWFGWLPFDLGIPESAWLIGKDELALPRVMHALALAYLVARLIPREAPWMHTRPARWLAAAGRHSLHVFCVGPVPVLDGDGGVPAVAARGGVARRAADPRRLRDPAVVRDVARSGARGGASGVPAWGSRSGRAGWRDAAGVAGHADRRAIRFRRYRRASGLGVGAAIRVSVLRSV